MEDLSNFENAFTNVRKMMEQKTSLFLPSIEIKKPIQQALSAHGYNVRKFCNIGKTFCCFLKEHLNSTHSPNLIKKAY